MPTLETIIGDSQRQAYKALGIDEADLPSIFAQNRRVLVDIARSGQIDAYARFLAVPPERLAAHVQDIPSATLPLQDPLEQHVLIAVWKTGEQAQRFIADSKDEHVEQPLIASAPRGDLNAQALSDDEEHIGILFESGLVTWAGALTWVLASILVADDDSAVRLGFTDEADLLARPALDRLYEAALAFIVSGEPDVPAGLPVGGSVMWSRNAFNHGMLSFVMGHEYGHIVNHHLERLRTIDQPPYRLPRDLSETAQTWRQQYSDRFPFPADIQSVITKVNRQMLEVQADWHGFASVMASLQDMPMTSKSAEASLIVMLGALSFLYSCDYLEKLARTLGSGADGSDDRLFTHDWRVQDLVLRKFHPCPLSRLEYLYETRFTSNGASIPIRSLGKMLDAVFTHSWNRSYPKARALYQQGVRPHRRWQQPDSEMRRATTA